jgi:hypothetical protein
MSGAGVGRGGGILKEKKTPKRVKNSIADLLKTVLPRRTETANQHSDTSQYVDADQSQLPTNQAQQLPTNIVTTEPSTSAASISSENTPTMRRHMFDLTINSPRPSNYNAASVTPKNYFKSYFESEKTSRYNKRVDIKDLLNQFSETKLNKLSKIFFQNVFMCDFVLFLFSSNWMCTSVFFLRNECRACVFN